MARNRSRLPARRDEHGECMHLYLTREAQCVHCGMRFRLAWTADRGWLMAPLRRNLVIGVLLLCLVAVANAFAINLLSMFFIFGAVFFLVRAFLGIVEIFMKHRFSPGKVGNFIPVPWFDVRAMKRGFVWIGRTKFPMDMKTYSQFTPDDTLLVEYLKWSRMPVAIYRGNL